MKNYLLPAAAAFFLLSLWSCRIDDNSSQPQRNIYNFRKGVSLDPFKKEYNVGDIFWMEVDIPGKKLTDLASNEDIFISNATFTIILSSEVLAAAPQPQSSVRFDAVQEKGALVKGEDFETDAGAAVSFGCPEDTYSFRVGLQLKEEGNYLLFLNRDEVVTLAFFTDDSDCSIQNIFPPPAEADLGNVLFTFDVEDTNLDVFNSLVGSAASPAIESYRDALENKTAFFLPVR